MKWNDMGDVDAGKLIRSGNLHASWPKAAKLAAILAECRPGQIDAGPDL